MCNKKIIPFGSCIASSALRLVPQNTCDVGHDSGRTATRAEITEIDESVQSKHEVRDPVKSIEVLRATSA